MAGRVGGRCDCFFFFFPNANIALCQCEGVIGQFDFLEYLGTKSVY